MSGDKLTVTAADRAAYADYEELSEGNRERVMDGHWDNVAGLVAFARHRTNTTHELVEALRDLLAGFDRAYPREPYEEEPEMFARARKALTLHDRALGK